MRVFLSGFMASGKTTIGRELGRLLSLPFVDLDERIEARLGRSIATIFAEDGEGAFRREESAELGRVLELEPSVIALGGGTVLAAPNRRRLREAGVLVWLDVARSTILSRLRGDPGVRPLYVDDEQIARLFDERRAVYARCDLRFVPRPEEGPVEVASRLADRLTRCAT